MGRVYNFSAGPGMLPEPVLTQAAAEMSDWHGQGLSVMEMSHRSKSFIAIAEQAEADLRVLLAIPDDYAVLFMQGGAYQQFAQVPMNLLAGGSADYLVTGSWSAKAFDQAGRVAASYGGQKIRLLCSTEDDGFCCWPAVDEMVVAPDARYVHLCTNETIFGVELPDESCLPRTAVPIVADMSSHILSQPVDVSRYGLIYAGAQKNIGPAGLTIGIIRRDLIGSAWAGTPDVMDYACLDKQHSMLNTPPTYAIYIAGLVFQWLQAQGGLAAMAQRNQRKAAVLYDCLDHCDFYLPHITGHSRSRMNVPFCLRDERLNDTFIQQAEQAGLIQLKGHKSVGGMRASIYNAMPLEGVTALVAFLQDFARRHG